MTIKLCKVTGRMLITITRDDELTVSICKNGTAVIEGKNEAYRDLYELLKGEMEQSDPHDHSVGLWHYIQSWGRQRFSGGDV